MKNYISILFLFASVSLFSQNLYVLQASDVEIKNGEIIKCFSNETNIRIPSIIDNQKVIKIGEKAFMQKEIENVILPNTIEVIGEEAFSKNHIAELNIPNSVLIIEKRAFRYNSIVKVSFGNNLFFIGKSAFESNKIESVKLPKSLLNIRDYVFYNNPIREFKLPVPKESGKWNLTDSKKVKSFRTINVFIPDNTVSKDSYYKVEYNRIIKYYGPGGSLVIPDEIQGEKILRIGISSFFMSNIQEVVFPKYLQRIEHLSFDYNNLKSFVLPNDIVYVSKTAFKNNTKLEGITLPYPSKKGYWSGSYESGQKITQGEVDGFLTNTNVQSYSFELDEDLIYTYE